MTTVPLGAPLSELRPGGVVLTIAVLTFRRPVDLAAVLPLLLEQAAELATGYRTVEVLVVDNDPDGSGRPVVQTMGDPRVRYVAEPEPGIAAARNRALAEAGAGAGHTLVFIDDDERPHPGWLAALLAAQSAAGAVAVAGAVVSDFEAPLDPWVAAGDFFRRRRMPTGTPIGVAATNNLLLDLGVVRAAGLTFDAAFGLSGGSDTLFTRQLAALGPMVWCDDAVVTDHVPAARTTRDWVLRRAYRSGNSASRVDLALAGGVVDRARARGTAVGRGLPRVVGGLGRWLVGRVLRSPAHQAHGLRTAARGAGMLAGTAGHVYVEYRRTAAAG